ncbi:MAG: hypothetical protein ACRC6M_07165 [Microcystaceae cyanobacterium]
MSSTRISIVGHEDQIPTYVNIAKMYWLTGNIVINLGFIDPPDSTIETEETALNDEGIEQTTTNLDASLISKIVISPHTARVLLDELAELLNEIEEDEKNEE